jgi:hypothetical protein
MRFATARTLRQRPLVFTPGHIRTAIIASAVSPFSSFSERCGGPGGAISVPKGTGKHAKALVSTRRLREGGGRSLTVGVLVETAEDKHWHERGADGA